MSESPSRGKLLLPLSKDNSRKWCGYTGSALLLLSCNARHLCAPKGAHARAVRGVKTARRSTSNRVYRGGNPQTGAGCSAQYPAPGQRSAERFTHMSASIRLPTPPAKRIAATFSTCTHRRVCWERAHTGRARFPSLCSLAKEKKKRPLRHLRESLFGVPLGLPSVRPHPAP